MKKQTGIDIIETSAKNSFKITEAMEMITKKLIERNGQGNSGMTKTGDENRNISLGDSTQQNSTGDSCCSFSF